MANMKLLVIEDSDEDFAAIEWAIQKIGRTYTLDRCADGDAALDWLMDPTRPWPGVVLLDLNLPGTDGREVLSAMRANPRTQALPVVILTTSASARDVNTCYALGANSYLIKPVNFTRFTEQLRITLDFWLETALLPPRPPTP